VVKESKLTANQRLLELIRKPAAAGAQPGLPAGPSTAKSGGARPLRRFAFGKAVHVGVDISQTQLVCVMVKGQDAGFEMLRTAIASVPDGVEPGSEAFVLLLRQTLVELCGSDPLPRIWVAAQSSRANLQFVTIPKVASKQVDNAVFWTAKKEMAFDEAGVVFDFERRGEVAEKGVVKLGAMAYTAPKDAVNTIKNDFVKAGFPLAGLTLESFSHQNLFRRHVVTAGEGAVANLHVGQNWSRLEIFRNGDLMFVRVIKTSMSGMEHAVLEALQARREAARGDTPEHAAGGDVPSSDARETVVDLDGGNGGEMELVLELEPDVPLTPVSQPVPQPVPQPEARPEVLPPLPEVTPEQAREVFRSIVLGCRSLADCQPGFGLDPEAVMDILEPVVSRLVRQVEMTLKHFRESLGFGAVSRVTVSGLLGASTLFERYIGEQLGLPCSALDPLGDRMSRGTVISGLTDPSAVYSQALGLALSDVSVTPNILFTYREKAAHNASKMLEQGVLVGLVVVLATMAFFSFRAMSARQTLAREHEGLARQLSGLGPDTDMTMLARKVEVLKAKREAVRAYVSRNRIAGAWSEALSLAPDGVGVGTLTAELGIPDRIKGSAQQGKTPSGTPGPLGRLVLEGMITGDSRLFDALLASYVMALEGSPLFEDVSVKKTEIEKREGGATGLRYVIALVLSEH
jgi:Tfp pilus assembly PilM family ATPase